MLIVGFIGTSHNSMCYLESCVHGLELSLEEILLDLAPSAGRISGTPSAWTTTRCKSFKKEKNLCFCMERSMHCVILYFCSLYTIVCGLCVVERDLIFLLYMLVYWVEFFPGLNIMYAGLDIIVRIPWTWFNLCKKGVYDGNQEIEYETIKLQRQVSS